MHFSVEYMRSKGGVKAELEILTPPLLRLYSALTPHLSVVFNVNCLKRKNEKSIK